MRGQRLWNSHKKKKIIRATKFDALKLKFKR